MSDIAKELFKSIVTDTASQEDFGSAIKQKMDQALDVRKAGITAGIYNKQSASAETFEEAYSSDKKHTMDPKSHVELDKETGMYCVYNIKGKKIKEFESKEDAEEYAVKNHDELMKESVDLDEATVNVDIPDPFFLSDGGRDPFSRNFNKLLKKYRVKGELLGDPDGMDMPEVQLTGKKKDLERILADPDGWDDDGWLADGIKESVDLEEAKMSPEDAEIAQEIIRSEDEKVSVAYGQKLKVARQKLIKKYGKGWAKMVESNLEEAKIPSSNISIFSDPKLAKSAASKQKYKTQVFVGDDGKFLVPSTNKEAGQLKKDGYEVYESTDLEEASSGDIANLLKFVAKNGAKVKGNVADFGGSKIEFSFDKGKIKFDGGKDSGVEYFDNLRDAISTLSIGMED